MLIRQALGIHPPMHTPIRSTILPRYAYTIKVNHCKDKQGTSDTYIYSTFRNERKNVKTLAN